MRPQLFSVAERENGKAAIPLGISFITEGAIPFAAADPLRVIPSIMAGSAVTGALSELFGVSLRAPHGGIFVLFAVDGIFGFFIALAAAAIYYTRRSIQRGAEQLQQVARRLADGQLHEPVQAAGQDEFSQIARAVERVRATLMKVQDEMQKMSSAHEAGDTDMRIDTSLFAGGYRDMAGGINGMVDDHIQLNAKAIRVVQAFGQGDFDEPLEAFPGKKAEINRQIETVRSRLKDAAHVADENHRIRLALDDVPLAVLIADKDGIIRYANRSVMKLLRELEPTLRERVPGFSADPERILGQSFDIFHKDHCAGRQLAERADYLRVTGVADQDDLAAALVMDFGLAMDLGHQRTGGVQSKEFPPLGFLGYRLGHAMGRKHDRGIGIRHLR